MSNSGRPSYRPNLNRNPTKKWAEAQSVDYDGDDWGDDDYDDDYRHPEPEPVSAGPQRHPGWAQSGGHISQRSFTNPSLLSGPGRTSFDRGDERRNFSAGTFESRYQAHPTVGSVQHQDLAEPSMRSYANQAPLEINTGVSHPSGRMPMYSNPQDNTHADAYGVPYSAPVGNHPQPLYTEGRNPRLENREFTVGQSQHHNDSHVSDRAQSPQQSNLNQQRGSIDANRPPQSTPFTTVPKSDATATKPLPFIRPADIYKRVEEEREKERRSQDSSRPSIDSATGKVSSSPTRGGDHISSGTTNLSSGEADTSRRMKSSLDTVAERKSEYGMSPIQAVDSNTAIESLTAHPATASKAESVVNNADKPPTVSRTASSVYTDTADANSAATTPTTALANRFASSRRSTSDSRHLTSLQYSPVANKPFDQSPDIEVRQSNDDLPNFEKGITSKSAVYPSSASSFAPMVSSHIEPTPSITVSDKRELQLPTNSKSLDRPSFDAGSDSNLSPVNTRDSVPGLNENSASSFSSATRGRTELSHDNNPLSLVTKRPASTEQASTHGHTVSNITIKASDTHSDQMMLPATTFVPGTHRLDDSSSTERTTSHGPLSTKLPADSKAQEHQLSTDKKSPALEQSAPEPIIASIQNTSGAGTQSTPKPPAIPNELVPPPTLRTTSQDWQEWEAQRRQMHARHGIQDSNTASPALSTPVSRAESPTKGTVKDLTNRLESNSGRSSPVTSTSADHQSLNAAKPVTTRNESFRPSIPGGWQSYTTNTSSRGTPDIPTKASQHPFLPDHSRTESTDSIPTATAPRNWQSSQAGPVEAAFAAAAAAGNAMMGAFSGPALTKDTAQYSDTSSDDWNDERSADPQSRAPEFSEVHDFAHTTPRGLPSETEAGVPGVHQSTPSTDTGHGSARDLASEDTDFPAPLRTSRYGDNRETSPKRSMPPATINTDHQNSEQLQHDIEQSLTPKTSNISEVKPKSAVVSANPTGPSPTPHKSINTQTDSDDDDDVLPQEYSSYWSGGHTTSKQGEHMKSAETNTSRNVARPPIPTAVPPMDTSGTEKRPFLEQRYSWEADEKSKTSEPPIPDFAKSEVNDRPSTPSHESEKPNSKLSSPTTPRIGQRAGTESLSETPKYEQPTSKVVPSTPISQKNAAVPYGSTPKSSATTPSHPLRQPASHSFPHPKLEFRNIMTNPDAFQRAKAFEENRRIYAEPNNLLEHWVSSLNTSEHADVVHASRRPRAQSVNQNESRPSPRREPTGSSGTKQMQEDGKRLLAAAGKYSGKAGIAAKGLFAKGKDRLRTASSGDKETSTGPRRKSSSFELSRSNIPQPREPVLPEQPPQIPTPALTTPIGETSWGTLSSKIDEMFMEQNETSLDNSSGANSMALSKPNQNQTTATSTLRSISKVENDNPPPAVLDAIPGDNSSAGRTPGFPNYKVGTVTEQNSNSHNPLQKTNSLRKVSTEDDRHLNRPRADSLSVPRHRRPSSVSDVSDISASQEGGTENLPRNVSPALESQSKGQIVPIILAQSRTKEEEAAQYRNRISNSDQALPAYSTTNDSTGNKRQSRIQPGTIVLPVSDIKASGPNDDQADSRPFSFFGSETLNHAMAQQAMLKSQTALAQQHPIEDSNRVDLEKSPQPNITEHPAYRNSHDNQAVESGNPLPSSRRSPHETEHARQRQEFIGPQKPEGEGGYRIPGPYVQEYRSPRSPKPGINQTSSPTLQKAPETSPHVSNPSQSWVAGDNGRTGIVDTSHQAQQQPDHSRGKSRTFGMFRSRSRSQDGRQGQGPGYGPAQSSEQLTEDARRRKGLFGLSTRQPSPGRQNREGRNDFVATQEPGRGRKLSIDMLKSSAFGSRPQLEGKKKRSSGFGALFGKSGNKNKGNQTPERYTPSPYPQGGPSSMNSYDQKPGHMRQPSTGVDYRYDPRYIGQGAQPQYPYGPEPPSGQPGTPNTAYQETRGRHGSNEQRPAQIAADGDQYPPGAERPQIYGNASYSGIAAVAPNGHQTYQSTTALTPSTTTTPPIPSTHASRDISYGQDRPYIPPVTSVAPRNPSPAAPKPEMVDHVKNLHKRSRSPRLGRPASDEHLRSISSGHDGSSASGHGPAADPVSQLGVFNSKKISPGGGVARSDEEQEKPWTIGLPDGGDDDQSEVDRTARSQLPPPIHSSIHHEPRIVTTSIPHHQESHSGIGDVISPVTAIEPHHRGFESTAVQDPHLQPSHRGIGTNYTEHNRPSERAYTPTLSNTGYTPSSSIEHHGAPHTEVVDTDTTANQPTTSPSSQKSRTVKQALLERPPGNLQTTTPTTAKPLTVAEQIMGIQPAARGTIPEHRSVTPIPQSPAPSVRSRAMPTAGSGENTNTIVPAVANVGSTMVATTMLRSGSIKTKTYVIDPNTPSRTSSNAMSNGNRNSIASAVGSTNNTTLPLAQNMANANSSGSAGLRVSTGSKFTTPGSRPPTGGKSFEAVELPGSKPDGYESEDEPIMSATAYPGQEWIPDFAHGVSWDDSDDR